jgi:adenylate kinase
MVIVLLGPPGSGKGTQAERLNDNLGFYKVSMGDLFREAIKKEDSIGKEAKEQLAKGKLVQDATVIEMVRRELRKGKSRKNYVFDGFPRNINQAIAFDSLLKEENREIDAVFYFNIPFEKLVNRLTRRRICPRCGAVYNLETAPPIEKNTCDRCNTLLVRREDDIEEVIKSRFQVYTDETVPVKGYYQKRHLVITVNSGTSEERVWQNVKEYIERKLHEHRTKKGGNEKQEY